MDINFLIKTGIVLILGFGWAMNDYVHKLVYRRNQLKEYNDVDVAEGIPFDSEFYDKQMKSIEKRIKICDIIPVICYAVVFFILACFL